MNTVHIASTANVRYFPGLEALVASTLLHSRRCTVVHFHIIDGGLQERHWTKLRELAARFHPQAHVHRLPFHADRFAGFPMLGGNAMSYARLLLGEYLPDVEKVLYLDSDILVGRDPEEIFQMDLAGRTALAADDAFISRLSGDCPWLPEDECRDYRYFNAGVLLLDLNRWRASNYLDQCLAAIAEKSERCRYYEQTALNYILRDAIGPIPPVYNYVTCLTESFGDEPANIHVVGEKPWIKHVFRSDHFLWRAFYEEAIDSNAKWAGPARGRERFLQALAFHPVSSWVFAAIMNCLIANSRHEHQRRIRLLALKTGMEIPAVIREARAEWRSRINAAASPPPDSSVLLESSLPTNAGSK